MLKIILNKHTSQCIRPTTSISYADKYYKELTLPPTLPSTMMLHHVYLITGYLSSQQVDRVIIKN